LQLHFQPTTLQLSHSSFLFVLISFHPGEWAF
jgi:hypothetical protein